MYFTTHGEKDINSHSFTNRVSMFKHTYTSHANFDSLQIIFPFCSSEFSGCEYLFFFVRFKKKCLNKNEREKDSLK